MVVIVWELDFQLPVPITSNFVSSNPEVYSICDKVCQWLTTCRWFSPGTPVSSNNKTDRQEVAEVLLKVTLITIHQIKPIYICFSSVQNFKLIYNISYLIYFI